MNKQDKQKLRDTDTSVMVTTGEESGVSGLGVKGSRKKEKGLMDMDNNVMIAGGRGI